MIKEVEKRFAEGRQSVPSQQLKADMILEDESDSEEDDSARLVEYQRHKTPSYLQSRHA
jgi:hypothetical protein